MSDDDPYRAPDSETEPIEGAIRPMSAAFAAGWTFLATFLFVFVAGLVLSMRSEASGYLIVTGVLAQIVAYSLTLFFMLRVHAPEASIRRFIGLRPTAWGFYLLGALLGLAMQLPMNALYAAVLERFPLQEPSSLQPHYDAASLPVRAVMGFVLVAAGPAIEEVFFRGALFAPLVRRPESNRAWVTIVVTGVLFAAAHVWRWQDVLCIIPMGVVLGYLRHASGSLLPSIFAHACFNAVAMGQLAMRREDMTPTPLVLALTVAATALVVGSIVWLGRTSENARLARAEDAS
jgi:membrane protease YdiL (CAAX protease family)